MRSSTDFSPSVTDVSRCPVSSWSSRASRRRSTSCAATTRCTASRATRCERSTATAAREAKVSARRRSSSEKRASGADDLVVRGDRRRSSGRARRAAPRGSSPRREVAVDRGSPRRRGSSRGREQGARRRRRRTELRGPPGGGPRRCARRRARAGAAATRSRRGWSSVSVASALPTSFSDSSRCDQRVASSARARVSAISFWIVKPTRAATLRRITIGRQADGGYWGEPIVSTGMTSTSVSATRPSTSSRRLQKSASQMIERK